MLVFSVQNNIEKQLEVKQVAKFLVIAIGAGCQEIISGPIIPILMLLKVIIFDPK